MIDYKNITDVHLEISSRCNAACPDCPRNIRGYSVAKENFDLVSMTLAQAKTIFVQEFVQQLKTLLINGNYGDFVTCADGLKIVQYLHTCNPDLEITISTNASGQPDIWTELGLIQNVTVCFRLDGLNDTHSIYRQNTDYDLILENAKKFIAAGGHATWSMIKFDYNAHQIEAARALSRQLGFQRFKLIDCGRNTFPIFDIRGNFVRNVGSVERNNSLQELIDAHDFKVRNSAKLQQEHRHNASLKGPISCVAKQNKSIYIQANGQVYPCCWTGFWPDKNVETVGIDQIKAISINNNALDVGIENAIAWFSRLEKTWNIATVSQGRSYICNETCGGCN